MGSTDHKEPHQERPWGGGVRINTEAASPDRRMLTEKDGEVNLKSNRKDLPQLPQQARSCQALHGTGSKLQSPHLGLYLMG